MKYIIDIPDEVPVSDELVPFDMCRPSWYLEAYEKGKADTEDEVWEFVRIITDMTECERKECFGGSTCDLDEYMTYQEAKAKYEAWKKKKDVIHVGDEVEIANTIGVVTRVPEYDEQRVHYITESGTVYCNNAYAEIKKTGRHFDDIEELLKKMRDTGES